MSLTASQPSAAAASLADLLRRRWTRAEYYDLIDLGLLGPNVHVELIAGEIIDMSPQRSRHASAVNRLRRAVAPMENPQQHWRFQLPLSLGPEVSPSDPEPDGSLVRGRLEDFDENHPTTAELVVEVSESTLAYDRGLKSGLYAAAGIPEYWILDLPSRRLEIRRQPGPRSGAPFEAAYAWVDVLQDMDVVTPLAAPEHPIRVADLLP